MGYVKVYDFGGIIDWPYGTVDRNRLKCKTQVRADPDKVCCRHLRVIRLIWNTEKLRLLPGDQIRLEL